MYTCDTRFYLLDKYIKIVLYICKVMIWTIYVISPEVLRLCSILRAQFEAIRSYNLILSIIQFL